MPFDVSVAIEPPFAKVVVTELNAQGEPKQGRQWYTNIAYSPGEEIELNEDEMRAALSCLRDQRATTIACENSEALWTAAVSDWLNGELP